MKSTVNWMKEVETLWMSGCSILSLRSDIATSPKKKSRNCSDCWVYTIVVNSPSRGNIFPLIQTWRLTFKTSFAGKWANNSYHDPSFSSYNISYAKITHNHSSGPMRQPNRLQVLVAPPLRTRQVQPLRFLWRRTQQFLQEHRSRKQITNRQSYLLAQGKSNSGRHVVRSDQSTTEKRYRWDLRSEVFHQWCVWGWQQLGAWIFWVWQPIPRAFDLKHQTSYVAMRLFAIFLPSSLLRRRNWLRLRNLHPRPAWIRIPWDLSIYCLGLS